MATAEGSSRPAPEPSRGDPPSRGGPPDRGASGGPPARRWRPNARRRQPAPGRRSPTARRWHPDRTRLWIWGGLACVLALALGLRLWGIRQGLPLVYNTDEDTLFVPKAIAMFAEGLNPHYFENPAAFTYALHLLLALRLGPGAARRVAEQQHLQRGALPQATVYVVYDLARVFVAVLGTVTVWLLYLTGARLFSRAVGLLAAAVMAVAFLPVFYSHLALNDVPTLAPLTLSLFGIAGVLRRGRPLDYLVAGLGLGLAAATKYTGGIVLISLLAAAIAHWRTPPGRRTAPLGLVLAGLVAIAVFVATNPYAILDFRAFHEGIAEQSARSSEAQGKLGAPRDGGIAYYLWCFTWGLGWVPSLAALGGTLTVSLRDRRVAWTLIPTVVAFLVFMGLQTRYFGRWVLPIFPIACLLGAHFGLTLVGWARGAVRTGGRRRAVGTAATVVVVLGLCWQGLLYAVHSDRVLSRPYTAALAQRWMIANVPPEVDGRRTKILLEPIVPNAWAEYPIGAPQRTGGIRDRWDKVLDQRQLVEPDGRVLPEGGRVVDIEDYERTLTPALIPYYEREGICLVVSGSTQSDRAKADPGAVPEALAYYRALAAHARVLYHVSPYRRGARPVSFDYDWSFDYYPLAYRLPGPEITIYRLTGGRCAGEAPGETEG